MIKVMATIVSLVGASSALSPHCYALEEQVVPENLGTPFNKGAYARNVWDMQVFGGRIYLGHGNSSNTGPDSNAGPIDIVHFDPGTGRFGEDFTVDEEQIDLFRVIEGKLTIPGHDPIGGGGGSFYTLEENGWVKHATIPNAIHVYDIMEFEDRLFGVLGSRGKSIVASSDGGRNWSVALGEESLGKTTRVYGLFELKGEVYATSRVVQQAFFKYDKERGLFDVDAGVDVAKAYPGHPLPSYEAPRHVRAVNFKEHLVYIGAEGVNDHQWEPFGLYVAGRLNEARRVMLEGDMRPWDILVRDERVYVLMAAPFPSGGEYRIAVVSSGDLEAWQRELSFTAPTYARSFEEHDGFFYFGLGTSTSEPSEASGKVLRAKRPQGDGELEGRMSLRKDPKEGWVLEGELRGRLEEGAQIVIQVSDDLQNWSAIETMDSIGDGRIDVVDEGAVNEGARFYRVSRLGPGGP